MSVFGKSSQPAAVADENATSSAATDPCIAADHEDLVIRCEGHATPDLHHLCRVSPAGDAAKLAGSSTKKSLDTISLTNDNAGDGFNRFDFDDAAADDDIVLNTYDTTAAAAAGGVLDDGTVISDLSGSLKLRRGPPRTPPFRKRAAPHDKSVEGATNIDSKKTESTLFETVIDTICNFCASLDSTAGGEGGGYLVTKEERKRDADDTFLGKIITCHPACHIIDVENVGCGGCVSL